MSVDDTHETSRSTVLSKDPNIIDDDEAYIRPEVRPETIQEIESRIKEISQKEARFIDRRQQRVEKRRRIETQERLIEAQQRWLKDQKNLLNTEGESDARSEAQLDEEEVELRQRLKRLKRGNSRDPEYGPSSNLQNRQSFVNNNSILGLTADDISVRSPDISRPTISDITPVHSAAPIDDNPRISSTLSSVPSSLEPESELVTQLSQDVLLTRGQEAQPRSGLALGANDEPGTEEVCINGGPDPGMPRLSKIIKLSLPKTLETDRMPARKSRAKERQSAAQQSGDKAVKGRSTPREWHLKADRISDDRRGIWRHPSRGIDMFLKCPHCERADFRSIFNFCVHMRRLHKSKVELRLHHVLKNYGYPLHQIVSNPEAINTRGDGGETIGTVEDDLLPSSDEDEELSSYASRRKRRHISHADEDYVCASNEDLDDEEEEEEDNCDFNIEDVSREADSIKVVSCLPSVREDMVVPHREASAEPQGAGIQSRQVLSPVDSRVPKKTTLPPTSATPSSKPSSGSSLAAADGVPIPMISHSSASNANQVPSRSNIPPLQNAISSGTTTPVTPSSIENTNLDPSKPTTINSSTTAEKVRPSSAYNSDASRAKPTPPLPTSIQPLGYPRRLPKKAADIKSPYTSHGNTNINGGGYADIKVNNACAGKPENPITPTAPANGFSRAAAALQHSHTDENTNSATDAPNLLSFSFHTAAIGDVAAGTTVAATAAAAAAAIVGEGRDSEGGAGSSGSRRGHGLPKSTKKGGGRRSGAGSIGAVDGAADMASPEQLEMHDLESSVLVGGFENDW